MSERYDKLKNSIDGIKCLVVGDIMLDRFLYGDVERVSPEAPVPIVKTSKQSASLGGAGNVAANIKALGAQTTLIGLLGDDISSKEILQLLRQNGISFGGFTCKEHIATTKTRIIGKKQQIVRFDEEVTAEFSDQQINGIVDFIKKEQFSVIVISDYNKGVCSMELCKRVIHIAKSNKIPVIVDPKDTDWEKYRGAKIVTPNFNELCQVTNLNNIEEDKIITAARGLIDKFGVDNILVTLSEHGMQYIDDKQSFRLTSQVREITDVSGAGDTVIAALSVFISTKIPIKESISFANTAAGLAVERLGTSVITLDDIFNKINDSNSNLKMDDKIFSMGDLMSFVSKQKLQGKKIVFTNGCFDILHPGHVRYLEQARSLGDILIVGVNSDRSIREIKGDERPINNQQYRTEILSALNSTGAIIVFDEATPETLLSVIRPDILVKGGDYKLEEIIGREYARETIVLPFVDGYSTTGVINKCREK